MVLSNSGYSMVFLLSSSESPKSNGSDCVDRPAEGESGQEEAGGS